MDLWRVSSLPEQQFFEKLKVSLAVQHNTHSQGYESNAEHETGDQSPSDAILKMNIKKEIIKWISKITEEYNKGLSDSRSEIKIWQQHQTIWHWVIAGIIIEKEKCSMY